MYRQATKEKTVKVIMLINVIVQSPGAMYMLDYCKFCNYMHILITMCDVRMLKFMIISVTVRAHSQADYVQYLQAAVTIKLYMTCRCPSFPM